MTSHKCYSSTPTTIFETCNLDTAVLLTIYIPNCFFGNIQDEYLSNAYRQVFKSITLSYCELFKKSYENNQKKITINSVYSIIMKSAVYEA